MAALSEGRVEDWLGEAAVLGLWEVIKKYSYFKRKFGETLADIEAVRPRAVIFIDYPGFNLRLARALRQRYSAQELKLIYFISPQVWAWKKQRVVQMAQMLDLMLCIFPFEKELYENSGLKTEFIGHPFVDQFESLPPVEREEQLIGFFPGSRQREILKIFPTMLEALPRLQRQFPGARFVASAASPSIAESMREQMRQMGITEESCPLEIGNSRALMQRCAVGAVTSGTATLEAALLGMPYCLVYRVAWPTYIMGKWFIQVPYLGIVNILAGREVVKELLQGEFTAEALEREMAQLYSEPSYCERVKSDLETIRERLDRGGAYAHAAELVAESFPA